MVLFIDDRPIRFISVSKKKPLTHDEDFDLIVDARLEQIRLGNFKGHTCLINISIDQIEKLINNLHIKRDLKFNSLYILVKDKAEFKKKICSLYTVIEAAGGVVLNNENKILWIYRLGKWDLPKGKLEKLENFKKAAVREVQEECNVKAELSKKLCTTYHTYTHKNERILKKTKWYLMTTNSIDKLIPQQEEGIEKVEWFSKNEMKKCLTNTYSSIRHVIQNYELL
jgi:ADP-ribose pyrophosphatase YjhB (NUDIX family)